ncbi:hypothetical protein N9H19_01920 [Flavobacteriales bacterium]|nr:hypothetical protein [Flavobacteriales bacterium]
MKKSLLILSTFCFCIFAEAQESVVKISGLDAAFGKYEISYERTFSEGVNSIKGSGNVRKQGSWPNILTKNSAQISFSYINKTHNHVYGAGLMGSLDTNTNHHPNYSLADTDNDDIRINDDPSLHSFERNVKAVVSGIALEGEYRSYFKTYSKKVGDPPRGWYLAQFLRFQTTKLNFDDNTSQEVNQAMNYLITNDGSEIYGNYTGPWEGGENTTDPNASNFGQAATVINPNPNNGNIANDPRNDFLRWRDVSFTQNETVLAGGLAIGRQWLIADKFSIDVQIGPQYQLVSRSERVFNGNDSWNVNQQADNINNELNSQDAYLFAKYGDVWSFDGKPIQADLANDFYGIVDQDGQTVITKSKTESELGFTSGFYRSINGVTDFARLETYRIKVRFGYAF